MFISGIIKIVRVVYKNNAKPVLTKTTQTRFLSSSFLNRKHENSSGPSCEPQRDAKKPVMTCLMHYGFNEENAKNLISVCPQIEVLNLEKLNNSLHAWSHCQFGEENLVNLLTSHPQLLLAHQTRVIDIYGFLSSLFLKKHVYTVLINSPLVITENEDRLIEKLKYLEKEMCIAKSEIAKSGALAHPMEHIRDRYEFVKRAGVFKTRTEKDTPSEKSNNPSVEKVLNTSDYDFSTKIAGLTLIEYEVFQELFRAEDDEY